MTAEDMDQLAQQLIRIGSMIHMHGRDALGPSGKERHICTCLLMAAVNEVNHPERRPLPNSHLPVLPCIVADLKIGDRPRRDHFDPMEHPSDRPRPLVITLQPT